MPDKSAPMKAFQILAGTLGIDGMFEVWVLLTGYLPSAWRGRPKSDFQTVLDDAYPDEPPGMAR
jgi:hypothetical protein